MNAHHATRPPFDWTEEACQLLRTRWAEGRSAAEVARELSEGSKRLVTRSAVCGKANRLGLTHTRTEEVRLNNLRRLSNGPKAPRRTREPAKAKPKKPVFVNVRNVVHNLEARKRDPGPKVLPASDRTFPLARPWTTRGFGECAFPIGEGADLLSCCAPTERTYCADCAAVMWNPIQPKKRDTNRLARWAA